MDTFSILQYFHPLFSDFIFRQLNDHLMSHPLTHHLSITDHLTPTAKPTLPWLATQQHHQDMPHEAARVANVADAPRATHEEHVTCGRGVQQKLVVDDQKAGVLTMKNGGLSWFLISHQHGPSWLSKPGKLAESTSITSGVFTWPSHVSHHQR